MFTDRSLKNKPQSWQYVDDDVILEQLFFSKHQILDSTEDAGGSALFLFGVFIRHEKKKDGVGTDSHMVSLWEVSHLGQGAFVANLMTAAYR